jgi:hypothetical protein
LGLENGDADVLLYNGREKRTIFNKRPKQYISCGGNAKKLAQIQRLQIRKYIEQTTPGSISLPMVTLACQVFPMMTQIGFSFFSKCIPTRNDEQRVGKCIWAASMLEQTEDPQESVSASMPSTRDTCHELLRESIPSAKYCWRGWILLVITR